MIKWEDKTEVKNLKQLLSGYGTTVEKESAGDILKSRYAAGEITKDEYDEKMTVITKTS